MSLYSEKLKIEINDTISRIKQVNQNIKILNHEIITRENVFSRLTHIWVLNIQNNAHTSLIKRLEYLKNQVH